mgnify:CR=1 FL=1
MSVNANPETTVGGIFWENATWTLDNSPYIVTDTVQIPENVVLTIEAGVVVESALSGSEDSMFLVHGKIVARGTADDKIVFDGGCTATGFSQDPESYGSSFFVTGGASDPQLILDNCVIKNGNRFYWGTRGHLNLTNSELTNLGLTFWGYIGRSQIYYPGQDVYIQNNLFINTTGFEIANLNADVFIRCNLFTENRGPLVWNTQGGESRTFINYNSFIDVSETVLRLSTLDDNVILDATNNYWGTTNTGTIDSWILDGNDDINIRGFIEYSPILTEPHPDTPTLCTHIEVCGIINSNTTWVQNNSPYIFTGPVGIAEGVTLTIESSVTVNFVDYYLEVNGTLRAQGSNTNKIFFTSDASNGQLNTPSIRFRSISTSWNEQTGSGSIIENAVFDSVGVSVSGVSLKINNNSFGGGYFGSNPVSVNEGSNAVISNNTIDGTGSDRWGVGIDCGGDALICDNIISNWITSGVRISGGSPIIEGNLIVNNTGSQQTGGGGIRIDWAESTPIIRNNTIAQNKVGINLINGPWPVIVNNNIQDNTNYNIYVQTNNVVGNPEHAINVTYNWWGTIDVSSINQAIYDFKNDFNLGTVTFVPFLTEPNPEAIPIPEFHSWILLSLLLTTTLLVILCRRKLTKTSRQQSYLEPNNRALLKTVFF